METKLSKADKINSALVVFDRVRTDLSFETDRTVKQIRKPNGYTDQGQKED